MVESDVDSNLVYPKKNVFNKFSYFFVDWTLFWTRPQKSKSRFHACAKRKFHLGFEEATNDLGQEDS